MKVDIFVNSYGCVVNTSVCTRFHLERYTTNILLFPKFHFTPYTRALRTFWNNALCTGCSALDMT